MKKKILSIFLLLLLIPLLIFSTSVKNVFAASAFNVSVQNDLSYSQFNSLVNANKSMFIYNSNTNLPNVRFVYTMPKENDVFSFGTLLLSFSSSTFASKFYKSNAQTVNSFRHNYPIFFNLILGFQVNAEVSYQMTLNGNEIFINIFLSNFYLWEQVENETSVIVSSDFSSGVDVTYKLRSFVSGGGFLSVSSSNADVTSESFNFVGGWRVGVYDFSNKHIPFSQKAFNLLGTVYANVGFWLSSPSISFELCYDYQSSYFYKNLLWVDLSNINVSCDEACQYSVTNTFVYNKEIFDNNKNSFVSENYKSSASIDYSGGGGFRVVNIKGVISSNTSGVFALKKINISSEGWLVNCYNSNNQYFSFDFYLDAYFAGGNVGNSSVFNVVNFSDLSQNLYKKDVQWYDVFGHLYNFFIYLVFDMPVISDLASVVYGFAYSLVAFFKWFIATAGLFGVVGVAVLGIVALLLVFRFT